MDVERLAYLPDCQLDGGLLAPAVAGFRPVVHGNEHLDAFPAQGTAR
jgi:hypothetical protein